MTKAAEGVIAQGAKVVLRRKRLDDASNDYAWRCDPELARFDGVPPLRTPYNDFFASYSQEINYDGSYRRTYAIEDEAGRHIGNVMYYNADRVRGEAELGISIGERAYWSCGYGTDAVNTFVRYLFQELGFRRIYLHTLDWNVRAQRCFFKAGFAPCGSSWRNGQNFIIMEMRSEWLPEI
ncbi:MAG: GNAT family N-acetyltransferase [Dehalococcoidia bacterium]